MTQANLVSALVDLGFTLNEARAYQALLLESPATGYEVGARAQIPRSAVYGVLRRLVATGAARSLGGTPERFAPAPAEHVVALLRKRFERSTHALETEIRKLDTKPPEPDAFTVRGYDRLLEEAERVIQGATSRLAVSAWPRELSCLLPELEKAAQRGVFVAVFSHAAPPNLPAEVFTYGLEEEALEKFWKHHLTLVADDRHTLIASMEMKAEDQGVLSQIALDITLLSQRLKLNVQAVMERMLGERVGRLDTLLQQKDR
jgi:sugar-specific transcriptional regulator TrmB